MKCSVILIMRLIRFKLLESVLAIVFAIVFISISESVIGIDVARVLLGTKPSNEEVAALNHQLGLDQPFIARAYMRISKAVKGDLGQSYSFRQPVTPLMLRSLENSLYLIIPALLFGGGLGILLGIWVAYHPTKLRKYLLAVATSVALLPSLVLSTLIVYGLGYKLGWITPSYIIAVIILSLIPLFITELTAYQEYSRILNEYYTRSMRSMGMPEWRIALQYSFKVAAVAIITNMTNLALYLLTATVFVEITFSLPGLGSLLLSATERFDYPVILGISLAVVFFFGLMNTLSGAALYVLDPRTR